MGRKIHTKLSDEGFIKGKKVFLFLLVPSLIVFLLAALGLLAFTFYAKKFVVNSNPGVCSLVRKEYRSSIKDVYPCEVSEEEDNYLVTFTLNPNDANNAPTLMSFKVDKTTEAIEPAVSK